ncbi:jg13127 [Pararge aegeria aegeria]|uniref:N-alpha-acetyltransferase 40 n=1 Tax=Pararge aegeria aegeria TaxID=348720 RepID=A0A8S4RTY4_9NEOP|nr:jg13127 [Pararge aegeria aegeria]
MPKRCTFLERRVLTSSSRIRGHFVAALIVSTCAIAACYEVQIEEGERRRGLGQHLMRVLERLAQATHMRCVRLTALTHNPSAAAFFKACGYSIDETSPSKEDSAHYEILSKATDNTEECVA